MAAPRAAAASQPGPPPPAASSPAGGLIARVLRRLRTAALPPEGPSPAPEAVGLRRSPVPRRPHGDRLDRSLTLRYLLQSMTYAG